MTNGVLMKLCGSIWLTNSWKQELLITEQGVQGEVIEGLLKRKMALPFEMIAQVNLNTGAFSASLEVINTGGTENLVVKGLKKSDGEQAKALIEERMRLARRHPDTVHSGSVHGSLADELQKLCSLRDGGDLTQQEFDFQKAKLLAR